MSGANNIPIGTRSERGGTLAQAAASLSGQSLLRPDYLQQASGSTGSSGGSSGGISKFGPVASMYFLILLLGPCVLWSLNWLTGVSANSLHLPS